MKIGDEVYVHGYVDAIRGNTVIVKNKGGYFGTSKKEVTPDRKDCAEIVYPTDEYIVVAHDKAIHLVRKDSNVRVIVDRQPAPDCPWK